jgi:DNA adenine methylase
MRTASPLRYPGGKWRLAGFFEALVSLNFSQPPVYIEPYAGGASLALSLLFSDFVSELFLNDLDPAIYAFWYSALEHTDSLIDLIGRTKVTPAEWRRQKEIYAVGPAAGRLRLGFATFFLNRTNHSGILNGGMIGGKRQSGEWKLDVRFNRPELQSRIQRIAAHRDRIHLSNRNAIDFIRGQRRIKNSLTYLDPPYFCPGQRLYMNAYRPEDHILVRDAVLDLSLDWVVSYDDVPEIRKLYNHQRSRRVELLHTARTAHVGKEVMFFSSGLRIPAARDR